MPIAITLNAGHIAKPFFSLYRAENHPAR